MFTKIFRIIVLAGIFLSLCEQSYAQESEINSGSVFYKGGQNDQPKVSSIIGTNNKAWGQNSFAGGLNCTVSGSQAFAFGEGAEITQENAFAIGKSTKAYGKQAFALGYNCTASGDNSFAGGALSTASGEQSFAFGLQCEAAFNNSIAIGNFAKANAGCSYVFGMEIKSESANSFVIGSGADGNHMLINTLGGIMMGINSNVPTFFISKSDGIDRTGRVGIGNVTNPQAKLHIRGDEGMFSEDASILLEPTDPDKDAVIQFWDDRKFIKMNHDGLMHIKSSDILLSNDDITPAAKLHIRSDEGEDAGIILEPKSLGSSNTFIQLRDQGHRISVNKDGVMQLNCKNDNENAPMMINGIVGINVANVNKLKPGYSLYVDGNVMAEKVSIKSYSQWPDFVFGQDYRLMPLGELKQYVSENSHLPEVPTEAEVSESGIDVAEMQGILLKKIEELTLYTIQLQEQIERQQKEIDELKTK